jgi:hypothetical protein
VLLCFTSELDCRVGHLVLFCFTSEFDCRFGHLVLFCFTSEFDCRFGHLVLLCFTSELDCRVGHLVLFCFTSEFDCRRLPLNKCIVCVGSSLATGACYSFYSCPAIFEVPLYLIIDRTSDSCGTANCKTVF